MPQSSSAVPDRASQRREFLFRVRLVRSWVYLVSQSSTRSLLRLLSCRKTSGSSETGRNPRRRDQYHTDCPCSCDGWTHRLLELLQGEQWGTTAVPLTPLSLHSWPSWFSYSSCPS